MARQRYKYELTVEGVTDNDIYELNDVLRDHLRGGYELKAHKTILNCYLIRHGEPAVGQYLAREQFMWLNNGSKVTFSDPDSDIDDLDEYEIVPDLESIPPHSCAVGEDNASTDDAGSVSSGSQIKKKLDDLKHYEQVLPYKTKFLENLSIPDLQSKQKSPDKHPTLIGSPDSIKEAELAVSEFLGSIDQEEIDLPEEIKVGAQQTPTSEKINSYLNARFAEDAAAIEVGEGGVVVSSTEVGIIDQVRKCIQDKFYHHFAPVADPKILEYLEKYSADDISKLKGAENSVNVYKRKAPPGYVLIGIGNQKEFEASKMELDRIIKDVVKDKVCLSVTTVTEGLETMMLGLERKSNVALHCSGGGITEGAPCARVVGMAGHAMVSLICGKLEDQEVDAIVNSTSGNLALNCGLISSSILKKAGPELQEECSEKGPLRYGQIVESKGYNLNCQFVYHCLGMQWVNHRPEDSIKVLRNIVSGSLDAATSRKLTSIAFPPIGCGVLLMPANISASTIFKEIETHALQNRPCLRDIRVVVHDPSQSIYLVFKAELEKLINSPNSNWKGGQPVEVEIIGSSRDSIAAAKKMLCNFQHQFAPT